MNFLPPVTLALAFLLTSCGAPAPPRCHRIPRESSGPAAGFLAAARASWDILADTSRRSEWPAATGIYNRAVTGFFDQFRCSRRPWRETAADLGTTVAPRSRTTVDPAIFGSIFPASRVDVSKSGARKTTHGLGLPVVGWIPEERNRWKTLDFPPPTGAAATLTVVLAFPHGQPPRWEFRRPFRDEQWQVGRASHDLAVDWSAAQSFYWEMSRLDDLKLVNVFIPDRVATPEGLFMTHAYDPKRIPVLFVHGLNSSPDMFRGMINELEGERWFRERYQVWIYSYPTGSPWPVSASTFRKEVARAAAFARSRGGAATLDRMVIVSHSMGGLLSGLSLRDPGHHLYDLYFSHPVDSLRLSARNRQLIEDTLLYDPLPWPERIVFLAVPHRGSPTAARFLTTLAANLIRLPKTLTVELADIIVQNAGALTGAANLQVLENTSDVELPTSIDYLSPDARIFRVAPDLPFRPGLKTHSVIGDRGRGDSPSSSDGLVPYSSSHIDGVESELIVPSDHHVPADPQAIREVMRILRLHLRP